MPNNYNEKVARGKAKKIQSQLNDITAHDLRVILISDVHINNEYDTEGIIQNMSSADRMQLMVDSLNAEHKTKPIDFVLFLGDLSYNNLSIPWYSVDGVANMKNNYLSQLNMPYYCLSGNHDCYSNSQWKALFGYNKNFTISFGNYAFICLDAFGDSANAQLSSGYGYSTVDINWLNQQLNKFKNKNIFMCTHHFDETKDTTAKDIINNTQNIICLFQGHTHDDSISTIAGGKPRIKDGNFSQPLAGWNTHVGWGFRNLEIRSGKLLTEMIYIAHAYAEYTQAYEVRNTFNLQNLVADNLADIIINAKSKVFYNMDKLSNDLKVLKDYVNTKLANISISYSNLVTNSNFANTTGWVADTSTISASGNVLSITGKGNNATIDVTETISTTVANKILYMTAKVRSRNTLCQNISLRAQGSTGGASKSAGQVSSMVQDQWYTISNVVTLDATQLGNLNVFTRQQYADATSANGAVTEMKEFMVVDITSLPASQQTKTWCDTNLPFKV